MFDWNENKKSLIDEVKDLIARVENSNTIVKTEPTVEPEIEEPEVEQQAEETQEDKKQETVENSTDTEQFEDAIYTALAEVITEE